MFRPKMTITCLKFYCSKETAVSVFIVTTTLVCLSSLSVFSMCLGVFPLSGLLGPSRCLLYSRINDPYPICGWSNHSYCYCLFLSHMYSLYLMLNNRPVCPIYFSGQSHVFLLICSVFVVFICVWGFSVFYMVLFVWNAIFVFASLHCFVISFLLYMKMTHVFFCCCVSVISLCSG